MKDEGQQRAGKVDRDLFAACEALDRLKRENDSLRRRKSPSFDFVDGLIVGLLIGVLASAAVVSLVVGRSIE